jgi:hypothetical protein
MSGLIEKSTGWKPVPPKAVLTLRFLSGRMVIFLKEGKGL